jgi:DNA-binding PadR family transcriptional regulator
VNLTPNTVTVALGLAVNLDGEYTGYGLATTLDMDKRITYGTLKRMVDEDWLTVAHERSSVDGVTRHVHRLTDIGRDAIAEVEAMARRTPVYKSLVAWLDETRDRTTR